MTDVAKKILRGKSGNTIVIAHRTARGEYIIPWYDHYGARRLAMRATAAKARAFISAKAAELEHGNARLDTYKASLSDADMREQIAACEFRVRHNLTRAQEEQIICQQLEQKARGSVVDKSCAALVEELLQAKRAEKAGDRWIDDLQSRLGRFAKAFPIQLSDLRSGDILTWLRRLKLSPRSYNNNRTALLALVKFARELRYLPPEWDELGPIKPFKIVKGEEELFTPEEMRSLLFTCEKHYPQHLAPLAIMGFAGCRHSELRDQSAALDWRDVHLATGKLRIRSSVAKSNTGRRYVDLQPNLVAWLEPRVKLRGAVCEVMNLTNAFARLAGKSGVKWKANALRNTYISSRCAITENTAKVAKEAGNSVREVDDSYRQEMTREEGQAWFEIWPTRADVLPLFAHAKLLGNC